MPALSFEDAVTETTCKYIKVGGHMIGLKPPGLYSLNELFAQADLQRQFQIPDPTAPKPNTFWYGLRGGKNRKAMKKLMLDLAATYVNGVSRPKIIAFSVRQLSRIINEGNWYVFGRISDSDTNDVHDDLGSMISFLHKHYGGNPSDWWDLPQYQLHAAAEALKDGNQVHEELSEFDFITAMMETPGMEIS